MTYVKASSTELSRFSYPIARRASGESPGEFLHLFHATRQGIPTRYRSCIMGGDFFSSRENTGGSTVNITLCHEVDSQYIYDVYSIVHDRLSSAFPQYSDKKTERRYMQGTSCQVFSITSAQKKYERMPQMALENQWLFYRDG